MRDMDRLALETYTKPIKGLNKHIESLENDLHYHDPVFGEGCGQLERFEWIGELKRERQGWIDDMQVDFMGRRLLEVVGSFEREMKADIGGRR